MSYIALVPARGGSKGIKNKNIVDFCGKPLIYWCLNSLVYSKFIDKIFVATDSEEIASVVNKYFGENKKVFIYKRLPENAQDFSLTIDLVLEFIERCKDIANEDNLCLVQATSPLLTTVEVDNMILALENSSAQSSLSCVETKKYHWTKDGQEVGHSFSKRGPRQLRNEALLVENGAVYINKIENIKKEKSLLSQKVLPFIMDYDTVWEIDSDSDLEFVAGIMKRRI